MPSEASSRKATRTAAPAGSRRATARRPPPDDVRRRPGRAGPAGTANAAPRRPCWPRPAPAGWSAIRCRPPPASPTARTGCSEAARERDGSDAAARLRPAEGRRNRGEGGLVEGEGHDRADRHPGRIKLPERCHPAGRGQAEPGGERADGHDAPGTQPIDQPSGDQRRRPLRQQPGGEGTPPPPHGKPRVPPPSPTPARRRRSRANPSGPLG